MKLWSTVCSMVLLASGVSLATGEGETYHDRPFVQDYSRKVPLCAELRGAKLLTVRADRNGRICVLSDKGLLQVHANELRPCPLHRPLSDMRIKDLEVSDGQFVYLTETSVLSNGWAGKLLIQHGRPKGNAIVTGFGSDVLLLDDTGAACFREGKLLADWNTDAKVTQAIYDRRQNRFLLLTDNTVVALDPNGARTDVFHGENLNCLTFADGGNTLVVGTSDGLLRIRPDGLTSAANIRNDLPCTDIRCIASIDRKSWFGTAQGAFALDSSGRIDYYASGRWLVNDTVIDIAAGPEGSVLVLSEGGLSIICFKEMTLAQKADHFDRLTRKRHIRYGFNSALTMSSPGDLSTGTLIDQDNDGLWTAMYLAGELFRYAVTHSDDALANCLESFDAMERLTLITPMEGFPARAIERAGYQVADKQHWHATPDGQWVWKGTTSSDEIVGHFFAYTLFAEIIPEKQWKQRAVKLMDSIMSHIVRNDWYLIDYDGKPTLWGRWHPEYVNKFPQQVGDRRLNSVEIISFLQAAYHFTGKDLYKRKAYELIDDHGYLDNINIPIAEIGRVPGIDLTTEWNHSDDELAFLSYWVLYRYAFTEEMRDQYRRAIRDHWQIERPEKNPLWSFIYADTGAEDFDLEEAIWSLKEFPLDTIGWTVRNSHRRDLKFLEPNFREQTTPNVLPPDERPMTKYNGNAFRLDGGEGGRREFSGDIYTLPYWMGRYLGAIK